MKEQRAFDQSDTPKTDAAAYWTKRATGFEPGALPCVSVDFARAQERRIAELEKRIHEELASKTALINECMHYRRKLRELSSAATAALTVTKS